MYYMPYLMQRSEKIFFPKLFIIRNFQIMYYLRIHRGRDRMVIGFTTTCAIGAYHN